MASPSEDERTVFCGGEKLEIISPAVHGSRTAQKVNFDVLAFGLAPELADQRQCPAADGEVPAIVLDATHLLECFFIEGRFAYRVGPCHTEQSNAAVITKHVGMHTG